MKILSKPLLVPPQLQETEKELVFNDPSQNQRFEVAQLDGCEFMFVSIFVTVLILAIIMLGCNLL